jgi:RNase H-fold protein (predicted Holliday junction resolvase)
MAAQRVLAIDPGTVKCGIAVVAEGDPLPLHRSVVARSGLETALAQVLEHFAPDRVLVGSGTASTDVVAMLHRLEVAVQIVDEYGTTLAARARYYIAHPPRGWRRLIPSGLRVPPGPIDDWAAVVIAEQFLAKESDPKKIADR